MAKKVIEFRTDKRFARRARELKTLETMTGMYCRHHHGGGPLCVECTALAEYARRRLQRCVFGDAKPTCANCVVHRHPVLSIRHMVDGRRPATLLPGGAGG